MTRTRLREPHHPTRLLSRASRLSALHAMARERMDRRSRMYNLLSGSDEVLERLGSKGRKMGAAVLGAQKHVRLLHDQAVALESSLWAAYPPCEDCEGTGQVAVKTAVGERNVRCDKCDGNGRQR